MIRIFLIVLYLALFNSPIFSTFVTRTFYVANDSPNYSYRGTCMVPQTTAIEVDMYGSPNYSYKGSPNYSYRGGHVWFTKLQL